MRSLGRVPWFNRRFEGINIVLIRNPFSQWMSGQMLADQGFKFFDPMQFAILSSAEGSAAAVRHADHHGIPRLPQLTSASVRHALSRIIETASSAKRFEVFASVYFLSYMAAIPHADLVVDIDRLSNDLDYRAAAAREIASLTGIALDFSDAEAPRYAPDPVSDVVASLSRIRQEIAEARDPLWGDDVCDRDVDLRSARALIHQKFLE